VMTAPAKVYFSLNQGVVFLEGLTPYGYGRCFKRVSQAFLRGAPVPLTLPDELNELEVGSARVMVCEVPLSVQLSDGLSTMP